jgi:UDP-N-acetylglucosamine 3-dehydrogenase
VIRIGVLGTGGISKVHARHLRTRDDIELNAFSINQDHLNEFVQLFDARPFSSSSELIKNSDVIFVCTPTDCHYENCLEIISAGLPIFLEKPIARDLRQSLEIIQAAERAGVFLIPGHVLRYFPEFNAAHELVQKDHLGKKGLVRTKRASKMPLGSQNWFSDVQRSGGVLLDLAIHDFDWLRWTFGEIKSVESISLLGCVERGDYARTFLTFESDVIAQVESSWMNASGFRVKFDLNGQDGYIGFDNEHPGLIHYFNKKLNTNSVQLIQKVDPYFRQIDLFLESIKQGKNLTLVTPLDGLMAVSIATAAIESAQSGLAVSPARFF